MSMKTSICVQLFVIAFALAFGQLASAQKVDEGMLKKVKQLVAELDSGNEAAIGKSIDSLVELGTDSLDALEQVFANSTESVQKKIHQARARIEQAAAEKRASGSLVTLEGEMDLDAAISSLEKQSQTSFNMEFQSRSKLELSLKEVPFWQAIDEIMDEARLQMSPYGGETGQLSLIPRPEDFEDFIGRTAYSGAFRVSIIQILTSRNYNEPDRDGTNIKLEVNWESHVKPIAIEQSLLDVSVVDEYKDKLSVRLPDGDIEPVITETVQPDIPTTELFIPMELIDRKVEKIDKLEGVLKVLMPGRIETFDFGKIGDLKPKHQLRRSRAIVTFHHSEKNDDLYSLALSLGFDQDANAFEYHRGWAIENEIYLVDAKGNQIKPLGVQQAMMSETEMGLTFLFEQDPKAYKLVYKTPTQLLKIPVKFKLEDIILP